MQKNLTVKNLPISSVEIPNHPINDMGKRKIEIDENFYIAGDDAESNQTRNHKLGY